MTYFGVLTAFIIPPIVALAFVARPSRQQILITAALATVALLYTTPWDNYLVATGVWWYDPTLVTGITLGWVPIEEYAFFVLQTLFTALWLVTLLRFAFKPATPVPSDAAVRPGLVAASGAMWLLSIGLLLSGWRPAAYLALILAWALVPIIFQLLYGADTLWANRRLICAACGAPTLYLWGIDLLAIGSGTWIIDPAQTLGLKLAGVLPVEEMIFFGVTNVLVVFGMLLLTAEPRWCQPLCP